MPDRSTLPHSEEMEKGLLCSLIRSPAARRDCPALPRGFFYLPHHQEIYDAICSVPREPDQEIDYFLVREHLKRINRLEKVGGNEELDRIWRFVPDGSFWKHYRDQVADYYARREIIQNCWKIEARMYDLHIPYTEEVAENYIQMTV